MSSSSTDSVIVDSMATYGRVKATIGLVSSIVIAVILLCSALAATKGTVVQTSTPITGHVVKKDMCAKNNVQCHLVVEYTVNGARQLINTSGPSTTQIGDTITVNSVNSSVKKSKSAPFVLVGVSVLLLGGGIMYYRFVMRNKYAAVYNAFSRY
jgi:hypothetical protein